MPEIRYIPREHLDVKQYEVCISQAKNSRIYAYAWYLDIVAEHWDVLVYDDYKAVMPLPWKRKYGIKYITIPPWVQQLGVFYKDSGNAPTVDDFINKIPNIFKKITYQFNAANQIEASKMTVRQNFVLHLNKDYQNIFSQFSNTRKRVCKSFENKVFDLKKNHDVDVIIREYRRYIQPKSGHKQDDLKLFKNVYQAGLQNGKAFNLQVWQNDHFLSGVVFLMSDNRLYSLFLAQTEAGRQANTNTLIYNYLIQQYQQVDYILDFEGSDLTGVAKFMSSFGAVNEPYVLWEKPMRLGFFFS